jgi:hypothetical protein
VIDISSLMYPVVVLLVAGAGWFHIVRRLDRIEVRLELLGRRRDETS